MLQEPRLYLSRRALYHDHLGILAGSKSREDNVQMQAKWATREWCSTISRILGMLADPLAMKQLGLDLMTGCDTAAC